MKIYIAGPMTGIPEFNFPVFHALAATLRHEGFTVISPAEIDPDPSREWADCLRRDLPEMLKCDTIYLLKGWDKSKGARLEHHIAEALGMTVIFE